MDPAWWHDGTFAGNSASTWLFAGLAFGATAGVVVVLRGAAPGWAARTSFAADDLVAAAVARTRTFFAVALGVLSALAVVTLPPAVEAVVLRVVLAATLVQAGLWATGLVHQGIERYVQRTDPLVGNATGVLRALGTALVWVTVVLLLLANLGVDVTAGIAGLGVGGVAVALAVQSVLGDVFASLSIVLDRPFGIGDFVVVDGHLGTVEHIGLKTTRIRSLSGELLVFGNGDLLASRIKNYKDLRERRCVFTIGAAYDTPPATVERIPEMLRDAIEAAPNTRFDRAHLFRFGESSLDFEVVWFYLDPDYNRYMDAQHRIYLDILVKFRAANVEIPFPQRTVWVQKTTARSPDAPNEQLTA